MMMTIFLNIIIIIIIIIIVNLLVLLLLLLFMNDWNIYLNKVSIKVSLSIASVN